ncbi:hypothetical protein E2C01_052185 [Portunus trituberculatus]|uniref:Uncharacterized protein n=1 Tax=Portunus trituberculatus TaxID=210409 RepID=A0A5B7GCZ7_PORTR|nr:hypothetical protein [Portunus trituberculatus]
MYSLALCFDDQNMWCLVFAAGTRVRMIQNTQNESNNVSLPLLEKVLGMFDLWLTPIDGDDAVIGTRPGILNGNGSSRVRTDFADPCTSLPDDSAGCIFGDRHL